MKKEIVSSKMAISLFTLFVFGTNTIIGLSTPAKQDSWVVLIISFAIFLPIALIYARILQLYPGKNVLDVCEIVFGKVLGKIFQTLFFIFTIFLAAIVMRNNMEFINLIMLRETPIVVIMLTLGILAIYLTFAGVEVISRWAMVVFLVAITSITITFITSLDNMDIKNIQPVLTTDFGTLMSSAWAVFAFPLAETVLFLQLGDFLDKKTSPYKFYLLGGVLSVGFLMLIFLRNHLALGEYTTIIIFPSYVSSRLIHISSYFSRLEGLITTNFILVGMLKLTVCVLLQQKAHQRCLTCLREKSWHFPSCFLLWQSLLFLMKVSCRCLSS